MNNFKVILHNFINSLHQYDYILFSVSAALFLLLLLLAIVLREKTKLSLLIVLLSFVILIAGPIFGYKFVHDTLYKNKITDLKIKKLEFSQALVIKGKILNLGTQKFSTCRINAKAFQGATNFLEEIVFPFKPFSKMSIVKDESLDINQSLDFKIILEPFTYSKEYNVSIKAECL